MTYFLYNYGSTLTISSTKGSSSTMITPSYVSVCRYAPGIPKNTTSLSSYDSMSAVRNTASVKNVGDFTSYFLMCVHWLLLFSQALTFTLPSRFSFRNTKEAIDWVIYSFVIVLGSMGKRCFISRSCEISSVTAFTPLMPNILRPDLRLYYAMMIPII